MTVALIFPIFSKSPREWSEKAESVRSVSAIVADIAGERARAGLLIEAGEVGALMDEPALLHRPQEIGFRLECVGQAGSFGRSLRPRFRWAGGEAQPREPRAAGAGRNLGPGFAVSSSRKMASGSIDRWPDRSKRIS